MHTKKQLRQIIKKKRKSIAGKELLDEKITELFISSNLYKNADTILCYASLNDEINTDAIIKKALDDGKNVALPLCENSDGVMNFYIINGFDDLICGHFGVREPNVKKCKMLDDSSNSVIVVPGLCFDRCGFRVGYGKGYYDRYLQNFNLYSVGLCYNNFIIDKVPADIYDKNVDFIVSEYSITVCNDGGKNG